MGILEAPMEVTGCCKEHVSGALGRNTCVRNSNKYNKTVNNIQTMLAEMCHVYFSTSFTVRSTPFTNILSILVYTQMGPARPTI